MRSRVPNFKVWVLHHWWQVFLHLILHFTEFHSNVSFCLHTCLSHVWNTFAWRLENQTQALLKILVVCVNYLPDCVNCSQLEMEAWVFSQNVTQSFDESVNPCWSINFYQFLNSFNGRNSDCRGSVLEVSCDKRFKLLKQFWMFHFQGKVDERFNSFKSDSPFWVFQSCF